MNIELGHAITDLYGVPAKGDIGFNLNRLIESRLLIQANSGGGKSWALRRLLEEAHGKVQFLVIDPEDEFFTLREQFDCVLAGRVGGDTTVDPRSAGMLARKLLEMGTSAILGIYELQAHQRIGFVKNFLEALVNAPKDLWHPCLVVVDEAHMFCPEKGNAESAGAVIDLMTRGRKRGFCGVLATQRISKLNKDAAAEANNKMIGRCGLDIDMKRSAEELGIVGREETHRLRTLAPGQFFVFGPAVTPATAAVTLVKTGDVRTTHPKAGARALPPPPPRAAIQKELSKLADLPKQAEEEIRTLSEAKAKIKDLERQLKARPTVIEPKEVIKVVKEKTPPPLVSDKAVSKLNELLGRIDKVSAEWQCTFRDIETIVKAAGAVPSKSKESRGPLFDKLRIESQEIKAERRQLPVKRYDPRAEMAQVIIDGDNKPVVRMPKPHVAAGGYEVKPAAQKVLDAMAFLARVSQVGQPTRAQVALLAGFTVGSGYYSNTLGEMRTAGLIEFPAPGKLALTADGDEHANFQEAPQSSEELQQLIMGKVPAAQQNILKVLIHEYPKALSRDELAEALGAAAKSGYFSNNLGELRTMGAIDFPRPGFVQAKEILFLPEAS